MAKTASMPEAPRLLKSTPTSRRNTGATSGESPSRGWKNEVAKSGGLAREVRMTLKPESCGSKDAMASVVPNAR